MENFIPPAAAWFGRRRNLEKKRTFKQLMKQRLL